MGAHALTITSPSPLLHPSYMYRPTPHLTSLGLLLFAVLYKYNCSRNTIHW